MKVNLQPHINLKKGDIGQIVLLPGDSARVILIADFLTKSRKIAQKREFLTYRGFYKGSDVVVTSTGIGCPSAAIAVEELASIGAKIVIRVGTCGAVKNGIKSGDLIIPSLALTEEGTSREYIGRKLSVKPDRDVYNILKFSAEKLGFKYFTGKNRTHDAFYESLENFLKYKNVEGLISSEMECSAIFTVARLRGLNAGAVLTVNTVEPFDSVEENLSSIYSLNSDDKVKVGISRAIQVALEAAVILSNRLNKRYTGDN